MSSNKVSIFSSVSSPEAAMYLHLLETGTDSLDPIQWFTVDTPHSGLILHYDQRCRHYSRALAGLPVAASRAPHKEDRVSLRAAEEGGRMFTVCTECGPAAICGDEGRQLGHRLYRGVMHLHQAEQIRKDLYAHYPSIGKSIVSVMLKQDIESILCASPSLLPDSSARTLDILRSAASANSVNVDKYNRDLVCLSVVETLKTQTRFDVDVAALCGVSDAETTRGLRAAWNNWTKNGQQSGLNKSFQDWLSVIASGNHTCPDVSAYVQSHSDEFLSSIGVSRETMLKIVTNWTREYGRLRSTGGMEYVAIYGVSRYHQSVPRSLSDIAPHGALLHSSKGFFAYGAMPRVTALYLSSRKSDHSRSPHVLPLGIPYDPLLRVDDTVLDTAFALFTGGEGMFKENAKESLLAAMRL